MNRTRRPSGLCLLVLMALVLVAVPPVPGPAGLTLTPVAAAAEPLTQNEAIITTLAGNGSFGYSGDGGPARDAQLRNPSGVAVDAAGNVYIADGFNERVRKVDQSGTITTVAGIDRDSPHVDGEGGPATSASLDGLRGVAVDASNLYIIGDNRIRKVDPQGIITTVAGSRLTSGYSGDGGPGTEALLNFPEAVAVDATGNLYIADSGNDRIRRVHTSGIITTVAGSGPRVPGQSTPSASLGDGGPATEALLHSPSSVTVDDAGNFYIADTDNHRIRKVDTSGIITTVAGTGLTTVRSFVEVVGGGYGGDGGPATAAQLNAPNSVGLDQVGNLFIGDGGNTRVRKIDLSGTITTVAGNGECGSASDGQVATSAPLCVQDMAVDDSGNILLVNDPRILLVGALSLRSTDTPDPVPAGGELTYTLRAGNYSQTTASTATLTNSLPPEATFVSARPSQGTCTQSGATVECALGDIPADTVATVAIIVTAPSEPTTLSNTATLAATHPDGVPQDNVATEQTAMAAPTLELTMTDVPDPAETGEPLTYTLTATNALPTSATEVILTDPLPPEMSFTSATASQGSCSESEGTVTCSLGTLEFEASATVSIVVSPNAPGSITNTATVRSAEHPEGTPASATTSVTAANCGQTITADTTLTADIGPCSGTGIIVGADDITLDLGGHRLFGFPEPGDGNQAGIHIPERSGVTVTNGTVSGFDAGLFLSGGLGNHTITGMTISDNLGPDTVGSYLGDGIYVENSPAAHIVGNTLTNNGIFDGIGIYGVRSAGATVENNLVEDSRGPSDRNTSFGQGIIVNAFVDENDRNKTVPGMSFLNNTVRRSDSAGISNFNSTDATIVGNIVEDNGLHNFNGNGIALQLGPGAPPGTRTLVEDNEVHGNGWDGIQVGNLATGNRILNNNATGNDALGLTGFSASYDLRDFNLECAGNVWLGNTWGSGGFSPECTTTGGSEQTPDPTTTTTTTTTSTTVPPSSDPAPVADFNGDGASDIAVFRPSTGQWYAQGSPVTRWGTSGDVPVPADYDGDRDTDVAMFRPTTGEWFVQGSPVTRWGVADDIPVPADYDDDGAAEVAVFRPSTGQWFVQGQPVVRWGVADDIPVPADYDNDGSAEVAVFRPSTGEWFVQGQPVVRWGGVAGDIPVPGDYDGDGSAELAVFRPATGDWFVQGQPVVRWGVADDIPVPGDYNGDRSAERAVFRPSAGTWFVHGASPVRWGTEGDIPVALPHAVRSVFFPVE